MSEKMTSITLPGTSGFADLGYRDRLEMIKSYRYIAGREKEEAEKILNAADGDFVVEQHTGVHVRRNIRRI
jgi:hypothetical protein